MAQGMRMCLRGYVLGRAAQRAQVSSHGPRHTPTACSFVPTVRVRSYNSNVSSMSTAPAERAAGDYSYPSPDDHFSGTSAVARTPPSSAERDVYDAYPERPVTVRGTSPLSHHGGAGPDASVHAPPARRGRKLVSRARAFA